MNNKKRIYAVLEVKERELLGKILFGINMSNLGYSVVIGKKNSLYAYQKYLKSGIYYDRYLGLSSNQIASHCFGYLLGNPFSI